MSTIFGIWYRSGKPVSNELEIMFRGIKHFPHERYDSIVKDNFAIGHMLTYNTPEAVHEKMPKNLEDHNLIFAAEGRIDNREELFLKLGIPSNQQLNFPDGDLILNAYLKWGHDCVDYLLGKWSLVAFHTDSEDLFIARDQWDYTSINYYIDENVFAFAPSNKALLPLSFVDKEINEYMIMRLLIVWPGDFHKTFHKNINRLLPSHFIVVFKKRIDIQQYWDFKEIEVKKGLRIEEYTEELLEKMNLAVKARLRSYKSAAATLSGGMDSSTVCVLAALQLAEDDKSLQTFSHVPFFEPSQTISNRLFGDERPYIHSITEKYNNIHLSFLNSKAISPLEGVDMSLELFGEPLHGAGNGFWMCDIFKTAAENSFGSILMGEFGNATISWQGVDKNLSLPFYLKWNGIQATLKKTVSSIIFNNDILGSVYKRLKFGSDPISELSYCNSSFMTSLNVKELMKEKGYDIYNNKYRSYKSAKEHAFLILDYGVTRLPFGAHVGHETGLELRDPTNDIRVITTSLAIPNEIYTGKESKQVLRKMMDGILPDKIRLNNKKGKQSSDITSRLKSHALEMDSIISEMNHSEFRNIGDVKRISKEWEELKASPDSFNVDNAMHLLKAIGVYKYWKKFS